MRFFGKLVSRLYFLFSYFIRIVLTRKKVTFNKVYLSSLGVGWGIYISGGRLRINGLLSARRNFIINITGGYCEIGDNCFFNNYCSVNCRGNIFIGKDCLFGEGVRIYDHNHIFNKKELIRKQGFTIKNVRIGDNVWIGSNSIILSGANIGDNSVISAGSIVKGIIPSNSLYINGVVTHICYRN